MLAKKRNESGHCPGLGLTLGIRVGGERKLEERGSSRTVGKWVFLDR